ncbi:threonine--tRNA ligase [Candidatus Saccharibacteria bacterium]|nr:threonine--tRNA ligase [Candidatus Saccharibacteria bacterium]
MQDSDYLEKMRHSLSHIMAAAMQTIWPNIKFGIGPSIDDGFYYDVDLGKTTISEDDLLKITDAMDKIVAADLPIEHSTKTFSQAKKWAKDSDQPYKLELIEDLAKEGKVAQLDFYTIGNFTDLCKGPHVASTGKVGAFKLQRVSGAYWRGDETRPQMQRVYGVAFATDKELAAYLEMLEEAKKRDHRKIGQELELFMFHETAPGMPYWLPNGVIIYNELVKFWREEHALRGYQEIVSPIMNKKELYVTSGHFDHYWDDMFSTKEGENGEVYGIKAMNCPNAMIVFGSKSRSYRDLPLRLSDTDTLHRNELSGTLNGLLRVREFRQDDAHIYVSEEQIQDEYERIFDITKRFYSIFDMEYSFRLGTRPEKFMGDPKLWDKAEAALKEILENNDREYFIEEGDGAFYGPKIDILMKDAIGRQWQMGTIQLDFQQPLRFGLKYTDRDGGEKTPICIHRVIYGSMERFIGILIEHLAGRFPIWLSPEQFRIIKVKDAPEVDEFVAKIATLAKENGVRVTIDDSNNSVGKKIRAVETWKIPYSVVVGEQEVKSGKLPLRIRSDLAVDGDKPRVYAMEQLIKTIANEAHGRVSKSSL